jgi:ABC-type uncharacterized transport system substrate-binding protein
MPTTRLDFGICLLALSLLLAPWTRAGQEPDILLVRPEGSALASKVEKAFEARLNDRCTADGACARIESIAARDLASAVASHPRLIVALGHEASQAASDTASDTPQLHVLVSSAEHGRHIELGDMLSAVYLEQPLKRYFEFIRFLMPERKRIGVLLSKDTLALRDSLGSLAAQYGMDLQAVVVESKRQLGRKLHSLKGRADVLLALPDPSIYSQNTLGTILLTTYRDRIPVIGFSAGMVKAGSIAGLYSSLKNVGTEAADAALELLAGAPASTRYPENLATSINRRVASAMHIRLPTDAELRKWEEGL